MVDQNTPHRFRRAGEEVAAVVEVLVADQRRYASWTRAVALRVCPGFSATIRAAASFRNSG
jgi:hypothetical protein